MERHKGFCAVCGTDRTFAHVRELVYGNAIAVLGGVVFTAPGALVLVLTLLVLASVGELTASFESSPIVAGLVALTIGGWALPVAWFGLLLLFLGIWCARRRDVLACTACRHVLPRLSQRAQDDLSPAATLHGPAEAQGVPKTAAEIAGSTWPSDVLDALANNTGLQPSAILAGEPCDLAAAESWLEKRHGPVLAELRRLSAAPVFGLPEIRGFLDAHPEVNVLVVRLGLAAIAQTDVRVRRLLQSGIGDIA